jgi:hypothetical protein
MRRVVAITLAGVAWLAAACGGEPASPPAPPGSPDNPAVAEQIAPDATGEAGTNARNVQPGYEALVDRQTSKPRERFTPCNLVSAAQARAIFGAPVQPPLEAPQGPTCIYRTRRGDGFATVAMQAVHFGSVKRRMAQRRQVKVADRTAFCGTYGQSMLYVPLSRGRVLSIAAPCGVAQKFAARAVRQLSA